MVQFLEALTELELIPEVERDRRRRLRRQPRDLVDEAEEQTGEVATAQPGESRVLRREHRPVDVVVRDHGVGTGHHAGQLREARAAG